MKNNYPSRARTLTLPQPTVTRWQKALTVITAALVSAMLLFSQLTFAQTVQVGAGTSNTANAPINSCYDYSYSEMIYDQSEIATAGTIEKVRFYYDGGPFTAADDLIEVYIGHTVATGFASNTAWIGSGGMTQVFSGSITYPAAGNWLEITLSTPFVYNNSDNLVVGVLQNEPGWGCSVNWDYTTSTGNKTIYHRHDGGSIIDPAAPPTANGVTSARPNIQLAFIEPCPGPSAGGASNVTYNSADISWGAASSVPSNGYNWEVRSSGAAGSGATGLAANGTTASLTANTGATLAGETTYTIYVRSNCGGTGTSSWATAGTFTTPCAPVTAIPYTEPFTTYSGSVIPNCWEEGDNGDLTAGPATRGGATGSSEWYNNPFPSNNSNSVTCNIWATGMNDWILSPGFTIPATPDHRLTYDIAATNYNSSTAVTNWEADDFVELLVSTDGQTNWTVLETYNDGNVPPNTGQNEIFSLNAFAGQTIYFAFRCVEGGANGGADLEVYIDNFVIEETPSCEDPTVTAATNIGSDIATLNWTASTSLPANGYLWEVRTSGAGGSGATGLVVDGTVGAGVVSASTGNTLSPGTTYNVYVQSDCVSGTSGWDGPVQFTTAYSGPFCDGTGIPIPDNACGSNELSIGIDLTASGTNLGTDVFLSQVRTTISHTWDSDLTINLTSPAGTTLELSSNNGGSGDNYGDPSGVSCPSVTGYTAFGTGSSITGGTAPFNSQVYGPEGAGGFATFTGQDPNGVWTMTVCDGAGGDVGAVHYFEVVFATCVTPVVTAPTAISPSSATLNWNAATPAPASGYQWEIRTSGAAGSGATGLTNSGSVGAGVLTAPSGTLTGNTTYSVYVRSNCGGSFSDWSSAFEFTTPCDPGTIPFFDGFEANQTDGSDVADCWLQESVGGIQTWSANSSQTGFNRTPRTGSFNATLRYSNEDWLFYPLTVTAGQSYTFDVYARQDGSTTTNASLTLSYGTAAAAGAMTGNTIVNEQGLTNGNYQLVQGIFTPTSTGTIYIGIKGDINGLPWYISIDDVSVYETPSCQAPANGVIDAVGVSNVEFSWDASPSAPANGYNYEVRSSGPGGAGSVGLNIEGSVAAGILTADSDDGTINTPLAPGTLYSVYVQAACGTGNTSPWIGPFTFTTPYANPFCNGTGVAIPDNGCGSSNYGQVAVSHTGGTAIGTDIFLESVSITIEHTWDSDLTIELVSPSGTNVELSSGNGGSGDDYGDAPVSCGSPNPTIFVDGAATTIGLGTAPFIGTFEPEEALSAFDGEDPNGVWTLRVCDGVGGDVGEIQYFSVDFVTCIAPVINAPTALASTSVTIDWDASGGASGYNWEIRNDNSAGGSGAAGLETSGSTTTVTEATYGSLTANTTYYAWVQTDCGGGDLSSWAGPVEFTTPCNPGAIPFFDGFEADQVNGTDVSGCWTQESVIGTQTWTANSTLTSFNRAPRTGSYNAYLRYSNEDWIFYPLALTGGTSYTAEAFARQDGGTSTNASLTIRWGSLPSAAAMTGNVAGANDIGLVNGNYQLVQGTFTPGASGTYYIGIKGDINGLPWYISIDDVSVYETPSCLPPDITAVTNVTGTSVQLNWDPSVSLPADGYEWEIRSSGAGGSGATGLEASGSTAAGVTTAPSGAVLTANSQYTLYVRSICSTTPSVASTWGSYVFSTVENDLCENAITLPCGTTGLAGSSDNVVSNTHGTGCNMNPYGVWYTFTGDGQESTIEVTTSGYDVELAVASGTCGALTNVDCEDGFGGFGTESVTFVATVGVEYYVYVSHYSTGGTTTGDFTISRTCAPAPIPPVNDDCANATVLNCLNVSTGSTENAVSETPGTGCSTSGYGVWYTFTGDGQQTTLSCDADAGFDHELSIASGSCGSLTNIACVDDAFSGGVEEYTFTTTVGVDYYVYVAYWSSFGDDTDVGGFTITRTCQAPPPVPANDLCSGAFNIDCGETLSGTTVGSEDETVPGCGMSAKNVWYTFVGNGFPTTITVTPESGYDVEVGYGTGNCGSVSNFDCDDSSIGAESETFNTVFGTTYYIYVGDWITNSDVTGTFTIERSCSGLAVWNGETSSDWNTATNWTPNVVPLATENAYIPGNPTGGFFPVIDSDVEIDEIIVEAGANVEILGGSSLTVTGDIRNDGSVVVNSTGGLVQTTGSTLTSASGTYIVKRDGSEAYDYWSSPLTAAPISSGAYEYDPSSGTADQSDDEFDPGWIASSGNMVPGKGYAAHGVVTRTFIGEVNNGNVNIGVSGFGAPNVAFNLIGNPYPCGLDNAAFVAANASVIPDQTLRFWDDPGTLPYQSNNYATWNSFGGAAGGGGNIPGPVMSTAQGFKVQVALGSGTVQFTNAMRSTGNSTVLFRQVESKRLWLNITHPEGYFNQTLIGFIEGGSEGYDAPFDAIDIDSEGTLALYSMLNDEAYAIQAYGSFYPEAVFPLGVHVGDVGNNFTFTIEIDSVNGLENEDVYLEDVVLGEYHDLKDGPYTYTGSPGATNNRFFVHFAPASVTSVDELRTNGFGAYVSDDILTVSSKEDKEGILEVIDVSGRVIFSIENAQLNQSGTKIDMSNASDGIYIVRFVGSEETLSKKVLK